MENASTARLAELVGGRLVGSGTVLCRGAVPLQDAGPGQLTMLDDPRRLESLRRSDPAAVVVAEEIANCDIPQIVVTSLHDAFATIIRFFRPPYIDRICGVSPAASIDPTARLGRECVLYPGVVIGADAVIGDRCHLMPGVVVMPGTQIGDDCMLFPGVVLYEHTVLEDRVTIHAASVLGAYGFGYRQKDGRHERTAQLGNVHIEADVEIGAAVTIDRGTYGATRIGAGTKIDNQVMIGHNCRIGRHNLICSQVGIAGSSSTGDYVVLAGQVGLKDHIHLGDGAIVGAQAGVMEDLPGGQVYLGSPATPQRDQMHIMAVQQRLPEMRRTLKELRRAVEALQRAQGVSGAQGAGGAQGVGGDKASDPPGQRAA